MVNGVRVALDVGNRKVKGQGPGNKRFSFSSVIASPTTVLDFESGLEHEGPLGEGAFLRFENNDYVVGDLAWTKGRDHIHLEDRARVKSKLYRVLTATALTKLVPSGGEVSVVFSLPVMWYFDREKAKSHLQGRYIVQVGRERIEYHLSTENMLVLPEGLGSVIYTIYDEHLQLRDPKLAKLRIGVIDIGGLTVDFSTYDPGLNIDQSHNKAAGITPGLFGVWEAVSFQINKQYGRVFDPFRVDEFIKLGYFDRGQEQIDITSFVKQPLRSLGEQIIARATTMWEEGAADVQCVVVTGGGAPWLFNTLQKAFPHAMIASTTRPYFANCEGAYRYACMLDQGKGAGRKGRR